jgi:hypothetical protein
VHASHRKPAGAVPQHTDERYRQDEFRQRIQCRECAAEPEKQGEVRSPSFNTANHQTECDRREQSGAGQRQTVAQGAPENGPHRLIVDHRMAKVTTQRVRNKTRILRGDRQVEARSHAQPLACLGAATGLRHIVRERVTRRKMHQRKAERDRDDHHRDRVHQATDKERGHLSESGRAAL